MSNSTSIIAIATVNIYFISLIMFCCFQVERIIKANQILRETTIT